MRSALFAVAAANRWLLAVSIAALAVLVGGARARKAGRRQRALRRARADGIHPHTGEGSVLRVTRGTRRRAGALIALGPLIGLACAPTFGDLSVVLALGAAALAVAGLVIERSPNAGRDALLAVMIAAAAAVIAGARLHPTGVPALDVLGAFVLIAAVTKAVDGLGNADGLVAGLGATAGAGVFAIAAFGGQDGLATVLAGFTSASVAFLAFNLRPASLFAGRAGRLATGYTIAVGALAIDPVAGGERQLMTPLVLTSMLVLDAVIVTTYRLRRRRSLLEHRGDHLVNRLGAIGWTTNEAVAFLVFMQLALAGIALFSGRGVMSPWLAAAATTTVLLVVGLEARRARLEFEAPRGFSWPVRIAIGVVIAGVVLSAVPLALAARDSADLMREGRDAASHALAAARDGDTITAQGEFDRASRLFTSARDKLESPTISGGLAVPFLASNVRAARELAEIGTDLSNAGESLTAAVNPDALKVIDGRLPLEEVARITPKLERGSAVLSNALSRLDNVRDDAYLVQPVRDAVDKIHKQLARAEREARHAVASAKLAPAIFGAKSTRRYLLVVQNNAESRATGGFIGSYGIITAENGKLHVSHLLRDTTWNATVRQLPKVNVVAPRDYIARYASFFPGTTVQNVNLSPDFPSVAEALMSIAPQAGQPAVDGVMSVDPSGLAALLELTGPVTVEGWPTPIDSGNVVNVTLRDAYAAFARTPERADFLGDVAQVAVDQATTGELGKPAKIAKVLGKAAHEGHLSLAFRRPVEQRLAEQLGIAQRMAPVQSDAVALTSSNMAGNKIDYYLDRSLDYRVMIHPDDNGTRAAATADLSAQLTNTAPSSGLPEAVIGPFDPERTRLVAGENLSFVSIYTPLNFGSATVNGKPVGITPGRERGRNVYSRIVHLQSKQSETTTVSLAGMVALHDGWYSVEVRHQPTLNADRVHVSVDVPPGWRIDKSPGMKRPFDRRADVTLSLERTTTFRVHVVRDPGAWDLWQRLKAGR